MTKVFFWFAVAMLCTFSAQAKGVACTEIGCENGVNVLVPDVRFRDAGKYQFTFMLDKQKPIRCIGELPLKSCDASAIQCSAAGVRIMEEGCAMPAGDQRFGDMHIASQPKTVRIIVKRDGKMIGDQSFQPKYHLSQPNGTQCTPTCRQATLELMVN